MTQSAQSSALPLDLVEQGPRAANRAPARFSEPARLALLVIGLSFAVHCTLAVVLGFSIDETYDVVMARHLALGYHDHPPAIMWLIAAAVKLGGSESHVIVRLPTMLLAAVQTWLLFRLTALVFDAWAGLFAVIALCLSPLFGFYFGTVAVTDGPLLFALTAAALFVARVLFGDSGKPERDWLLGGLFFGFALLSKFSAILALPGLALFVLTVPRHRRVFLTMPPYLAALLALAVFAPVIVWNFANGLSAFQFQGSRAMPGAELHIARTLTHLGILFAFIGPAVWLAQIATLAGAIGAGPRDEKRWFFACLAVVPILFFLLLDLFGTSGDQGPHWPAPGYLFTFPLVGAAVAYWRPRLPRTIRWSIASCTAAAALLVVTLVSHTLTGWLQSLVPSWKDYDPIVADDADWWSLRARLAENGMLDSRHFVVVGRYYFCFKAQLVLKDSVPIVCLADNPIALSLWRDDAALLGRDAVMITTWWRARQPLPAIEGKFERVEPLGPLWIVDHGRNVMRVDLALGHNLRRSFFDHPADPR